MSSAMTYIDTARDIARQEGRRVYVRKVPGGGWAISDSARGAYYVVHPNGHVELL